MGSATSEICTAAGDEAAIASNTFESSRVLTTVIHYTYNLAWIQYKKQQQVKHGFAHASAACTHATSTPEPEWAHWACHMLRPGPT